MTYAIGIDVGGTHIKGAACSPEGEIRCRQMHETIDGDMPHCTAAVRTMIAELENACGAPAAAVGVAAPGLARADGRAIEFMPGRLRGLEGFEWSTALGREFAPVLNDGHAALLGERWSGAARGLNDVILLTLGTGVGGAIISGGRLLRGAFGRAGHLGHICLNPHGPPDIVGLPGSLEDAVGNATLTSRSGGGFSDTRALIAAAEAGDETAANIWHESIRTLACGIASLVNILDPEAIILGGGIAEAGDALLQPLAATLDEVEWRPAGRRVQLRRATLGDFAGACGAAWNAIQSIK